MTAAAAAISVISCEQNVKPEEEPAAATELKSLTESVDATAEGGEYEIGYAVINPTETGEIMASVKGGSDWISGFDTGTPNKVRFTVSPNEAESARVDAVIVSYENCSFEVEVTQDAKEPEKEVVEFTADVLEGVYYGKLPGSDSYNWNFYFSDKGLDEYMSPSLPDAVYYNVSLYDQEEAEISENEAVIPEGTYQFNLACQTEGMGFNGGYWLSDSNGAQTEFLYYEEGELKVTRTDGDVYALELTVVTDDGQTRHVTYEGVVALKDESPGGEPNLPLVDKDILDVDFTGGYAWTEDSGVENVSAIAIQLFTSDYAVMLNAKIYTSDLTPDATDVPAGTYRIGEDGEAVSGTFMPGGAYQNYPNGTYVTVMSDGTYGIVDGGTVTVSGSEAGTEIVLDLTMGGFRLTGVFDGSLPVLQQ